MENKKNMCVLFSAFDFDRRFVFQLRGHEMPAPGPKEKGDKKDRITEKPDPKKALGELAASIETEKGPEKPYSITKIEEIRRTLDKAVARLRGTTRDKKFREYPPVLKPIADRIRVAGETLKLNPDDYVYPMPFVDGNGTPEILIRCANVVEDVSTGETGEGQRTIKNVAEVAEDILPWAMVWINPTTRREQVVVIALIDDFKIAKQRSIDRDTEEAKRMGMMSLRYDWQRRGLQARVEYEKKSIAELDARKAEVQAMKFPQ